MFLDLCKVRMRASRTCVVERHLLVLLVERADDLLAVFLEERDLLHQVLLVLHQGAQLRASSSLGRGGASSRLQHLQHVVTCLNYRSLSRVSRKSLYLHNIDRKIPRSEPIHAKCVCPLSPTVTRYPLDLNKPTE